MSSCVAKLSTHSDVYHTVLQAEDVGGVVIAHSFSGHDCTHKHVHAQHAVECYFDSSLPRHLAILFDQHLLGAVP